MVKVTLSRLGLVPLTLAASLAPGCGSGSGGAGAEGQACYPNGTCDAGLTCASDLCVSLGGSGNASGAGGSDDAGAVAAAVEACFACGETQCTAEAEACSSAEGCRELLDCTLGCAGDPACANACDVSGVTADGVQAMSAFTGCVVTSCVQECTTDIQNAVGGGTDIGTGGGGTNTGGGGGIGATGGGGGTIGGGGSGGSGGPKGPNLILNGDFSSGLDYWSADGHAGGGYISTTGGEVCVYNEGDLNLAFSLGFPADTADAFTLEGGKTYTLTYTVSGYIVEDEGEAKVGLAVEPWTSIAAYRMEVWNDFDTRSHTFTPSSTYTDVGFVFNVSVPGYDPLYGAPFWVCFDDVSLLAH